MPGCRSVFAINDKVHGKIEFVDNLLHRGRLDADEPEWSCTRIGHYLLVRPGLPLLPGRSGAEIGPPAKSVLPHWKGSPFPWVAGPGAKNRLPDG
jgi:hypothetical protein